MYSLLCIYCIRIYNFTKTYFTTQVKGKATDAPQRNNCETLPGRFLKRNLSSHSRLPSFYITFSVCI